MATIDKIRQNRIEKLERMKKAGIDPYPASTKRTHKIEQALSDFIKLSKAKKKIVLVGRIRLMRQHGKSCFLHLEDGSGKIQAYFKQDKVGKEKYKFFLDNFDVGDFVEVRGILFKTKTKEKTLLVSSYKILSKSLLPLPEKWQGLKDEEERYRKRYLDFIFNPELKQMFEKKAVFWNSMRDFLVKKEFTEVETPVLENVAGGANANPFVTHHNALDIDLYLRISMGELWQKKLMVGGFEKTFEIGRQFRNEGISKEHLQDYTQMEFYWAYADYKDGMKLVEEMYKQVIKKTFGTLKFRIFGFNVDFSKKWGTIDYSEAIQKKFKIDVDNTSKKEVMEILSKLKVKYNRNFELGRLIDILWKQIRKDITGPIFLTGHPVSVSPLSKRDSIGSEKTQRFQVIIAGSEIGNGYSELNDPLDQAERFDEQAGRREKGDLEAHMHDQEFVDALEYGMPPTCGFGVSERLFSFLLDKPIRECVMFPLLRPKDGFETKRQDFNKKISIVVDEKLPSWQVLNTVGHISAYFGNKVDNFDTGSHFITRDKIGLPRNGQYPIVVLRATKAQVQKFAKEIRDLDIKTMFFPQEMIDLGDDEKLSKALKRKDFSKISFAGVGLFGSNEEIKELTKGFKLWNL